MKALKIVIGTILGLIALMVAVGFALPDTAHVERSTVVQARPATAYAVLNGFKQFRKWSPWDGLDPNTQYTTSGPIWGVGAGQAWRGDDRVGAGSQEIIATEPNQSVTIKLVFEGFDSENTARYLIAPEGEGSRITWSYDSVFNGNLLGRYFGLMMDKMLGADYEKGLAQLKTLLESLPKDDFSGIEPAVVQTTAQPILYIAGSAGPADGAAQLGAAYGQVMGYMQAHGIQQVAAPLAVTRKYDEATKAWDFDAGIPVDKTEPAPPADGAVKAGQTYAGWVIRATHTGPYEAMEPTYAKLMAFRTAAGFEDNGNSWEQYITDPTTVAPEAIKTHVYWPIK